MPTLSEEQVKIFQRLMNKVSNKYLRKVNQLVVDGDPGAATQRRARWLKFYGGWGATVAKNSPALTPKFEAVLRDYKGSRWGKQVLRAGRARRIRQRVRSRVEGGLVTIAPGVTKWRGVPVAKVLVPHLNWAVEDGWKGTLVSGWRSIAYSISLCIRMCGARICPGRCGGPNTNHVGTTKQKCAIDVSLYDDFGRRMRRCPHSPRIFNALGRQDPVHFSPTGR